MNENSPAPSAPPESRNRVRTFASLAHRDYRFLFAGNLFNNMALWLQLISLSWLTWELTKDPATGQGSALLSGTAGGLRALPTLVIGPWAGVLADRFDRRMLLSWAQIAMACMGIGFAVLVVEGQVEVWHVFLYAAVNRDFHRDYSTRPHGPGLQIPCRPKTLATQWPCSP